MLSWYLVLQSGGELTAGRVWALPGSSSKAVSWWVCCLPEVTRSSDGKRSLPGEPLRLKLGLGMTPRAGPHGGLWHELPAPVGPAHGAPFCPACRAGTRFWGDSRLPTPVPRWEGCDKLSSNTPAGDLRVSITRPPRQPEHPWDRGGTWAVGDHPVKGCEGPQPASAPLPCCCGGS